MAFECGSAVAASPISEGHGEPGGGPSHPLSLQNTQPARGPAPLQPWGPVMGRTQALGCTPTGLRGRHPKNVIPTALFDKGFIGKTLHEFEWKQNV